MIKNIDHLSDLLKNEKRKHKPLYSNCLLSPDKINELAADFRLEYEIHKDGIILLNDKDHYIRLYYFLYPQNEIEIAKKDKPLIVEFNDSEKSPSRQNKIMMPYFQKAGFQKNATVRRIYGEYDEKKIEKLINAHVSVYDVITARPEHFERILELLYEAFDPIDNLFPSNSELKKALDDGEFKCIVDENNQVMGAMQSVIRGNEIDMRRIVVDKSYRGKNISWHLRKHETKRAWDNGIKKRVGWVLEGNDAALISARKIGMELDGRFDVHYILR